MTRSNVVAVISFAVVFAAGCFVGQLGWGGGKATHGGGSLTSQLDLSPPQQEAVRKIWNEQLKTTTSVAEKRWKEAERERDAAMRKLLTPLQLNAYEQIEADHQEREKAFRVDLLQSQSDAENRTRELLTPSQREKFEKYLAERRMGSARGAVIPAGVPVSDFRGAPVTLPKEAQAR